MKPTGVVHSNFSWQASCLRKGWESSLDIGREALGCCSEVKQQLLCDPASEKDGTKPARSLDSGLLDDLCQLCAFEKLPC